MREVLNPGILRTLIVFAVLAMFSSPYVEAAEKKASESPPLSYSLLEARSTILNPHEQINDEGEIMWSRCLICHKTMPDTVNYKSPENMKFRFPDNLDKNCYVCHNVRKHPGSEGIGPAMSGFVAPSHLAEPSRTIYLNMRLVKKELPVLLPLDPATGKIFCGTCHNPHERGLLHGRPNWGADQDVRLRTEGGDICQYCHRK